jgi:hypothetical protein
VVAAEAITAGAPALPDALTCLIRSRAVAWLIAAGSTAERHIVEQLTGEAILTPERLWARQR